MAADGQATIARRLRTQGRQCAELGSPLYAALLEDAAVDAEAGGVVWEACRGHEGERGEGALAVRLLGAVHHLALSGAAPTLAALLPSCGGTLPPDGSVWPVWRDALASHVDSVRPRLDRAAQTNEVGRAAALLGGFMCAYERTSLPLRLLEVGASAGLLLRWDKYGYSAGDRSWGDPASLVKMPDAFADRVPQFSEMPPVAARSGCDLHPVDPTTPEGELWLTSFVWPDQVRRLALLRAACAVARDVPAVVEQHDAVSWLSRELAAPADGDGVTTVVYHSVVLQYLAPETRDALRRVVFDAGARASAQAPLAWLRFEPAEGRFEVRLTLWPSGGEELVAVAPAHGLPTTWLG
jgi:hypothetical protein